MINFKEIELSDKSWIDPLIAAADLEGCHYNFTNLFAWSKIYNHHVAQVNDCLVVKGHKRGDIDRFFYPVGIGNIKETVDEMRTDAAACGNRFILYGVTPENMAVLDTLYPGSFQYHAMQDSFDYVYELDKMVSLAGKKLQSKRNHINRFKLQNSAWSFEIISPGNLQECWEMNKEWCLAHDCDDDVILANETCAVQLCFENYSALNLEGALLRSGGKVIAYTMGEPLNSHTYVTHIEKAFSDIQGAYQMINREFSNFIKTKHPQLIYVNREEDMGYEGLRRAKQSYYPFKMVEKYMAQFRG